MLYVGTVCGSKEWLEKNKDIKCISPGQKRAGQGKGDLGKASHGTVEKER